MSVGRIALLGAGKVGTTLGAGFVKHGHEVVLGSREPGSDKVRAWLAEMGPNACSGTYSEALASADCIFLCIPGRVLEETVAALPAGSLDGKVVVDVSNHMAKGESGSFSLPMGLEDSAAQRIQRARPSARLVKAFNTTGVQSMIEPHVRCGPPTMPICGDDMQAKADVAELLREVGWEPVDLGGIALVPVLEVLTVAWLQYGRATGAYDHCYKFVKP